MVPLINNVLMRSRFLLDVPMMVEGEWLLPPCSRELNGAPPADFVITHR